MSAKLRVSFTINDAPVAVDIAPHDRLIDVLRGPLGLTGTKEGCGNGECGACTVIIDGQALNACLYPAAEVEGKALKTIEGLVGPGGKLSPLQQAFVQEGAIQCGFCSPGMIMSAQALLEENASPSDDAIRDALVGNLCRCTGYVQILDSVKAAAQAMRNADAEGE